MRYCEKCHVNILGSGSQCPLCSSTLLPMAGDRAIEGFEAYPDMKDDAGKYNFLLRLFLFLSVAAGLICLLLNFLFWTGILWSLIVGTGILLLWETIGLMVLSRINMGWKLFAQMLAVMVVFLTIDAVTGWGAWSITYIAPFVIIASTLAMTLVLFIRRAKWREYMLFQFIIALNGFVPVILYCFGLTRILWPGAAAALYALLTLLGMLTFADRQFKNELNKRFHI
jgi:hypothetical protein